MMGVWGWLIAFLLGIATGVLLFVSVLRRKMLEVTPSGLSFEETESRLRNAPAAAPGWGFPAPDLDFTAALANKGFSAPGIKRAKIFFLCNPRYASSVVGADHRMIGMMPCHWALYETAAGQVFLSRLNLPLMSRMFRGEVGRAMAQVARDEREKLVPLAVGADSKST
jgi:uncharacterized protein (DUF302 family)